MNPNPVVLDGALWLSLPLALAAGLLSFLSPCILPLVPGYLGFISGAVSEDKRTTPGSGGTATVARSRLVLGVLLFIAGFTVFFVAYTALAGAASLFFAQWGDLITRIMGVLVILMGLVFIGQFSFLQRTMRMNLSGRTGLIGAPLLGMALAVGWTPCMGPTLAAIQALAWNVGDPLRAGVLGLAYSLGLGVPFLLLALGFGWATRSVAFIRKHIRVVNIAGGVLLIIMGLLMVTGIWTQLMARIGSVMVNVPTLL